MKVKTCNTCFNAGQVLDGSHSACISCVNYDKWVSRDVFKNIDNHGEAMVERVIPPPQYDPKDVAFNALDVQVAGSHYKKHGIQPVEYIHTNKIGYFEGNVIKYVTRWRDKGGIADLEKAKHYIDLLIELEGKNNG
jgi:hypothetical protein